MNKGKLLFFSELHSVTPLNLIGDLNSSKNDLEFHISVIEYCFLNERSTTCY